MEPIMEGLKPRLVGALLDSRGFPKEAPGGPQMKWISAVDSMGCKSSGLGLTAADSPVVLSSGMVDVPRDRGFGGGRGPGLGPSDKPWG